MSDISPQSDLAIGASPAQLFAPSPSVKVEIHIHARSFDSVLGHKETSVDSSQDPGESEPIQALTHFQEMIEHLLAQFFGINPEEGEHRSGDADSFPEHRDQRLARVESIQFHFRSGELHPGQKIASGTSRVVFDQFGPVQVQEPMSKEERTQKGHLNVGVSSSSRSSENEIGLNFSLNVSAQNPSGTLKDPLILNLDGEKVEFEHSKFSFDLDMDGALDQLPQFANASAFLAWDKNLNGQIDNGSELFGPQSGHGFQELSALDSNQSGVIDSADKLFLQLSLWQNPGSKTADGLDHLSSLSSLGVQGLNLARSLDAHALHDSKGNWVGQNRETGSFHKVDGGSGLIQESDFWV